MYTTLHQLSQFKVVAGGTTHGNKCPTGMYTTSHQLSQHKTVAGAQPMETNVQQKCTQLYTGYPSIRLSLGHNLWKQMSNKNVDNFTPGIPV